MDTNHRSKHKIRSIGGARWCLFQVYKTRRQNSIAVCWTICVYVYVYTSVMCEKRIEERETRVFLLDACKAGSRSSKGSRTNANKQLASMSTNGLVSTWKQAADLYLLALVYLARIQLEIIHEQKRTLSTEYRRNTSDIRDLLDSKLSGDSPPRAVAWHGFLVAVNFPLIVVQSIGLHVVAREGMHGRRKKHTLH